MRSWCNRMKWRSRSHRLLADEVAARRYTERRAKARNERARLAKSELIGNGADRHIRRQQFDRTQQLGLASKASQRQPRLRLELSLERARRTVHRIGQAVQRDNAAGGFEQISRDREQLRGVVHRQMQWEP